MARFVTGPVVTSASSSATSIGLLLKKFISSHLAIELESLPHFPSNHVAECRGSSPWRSLPTGRLPGSRPRGCSYARARFRLTDEHLRRVGVERRPIDGPVCAVVVSQSFVG